MIERLMKKYALTEKGAKDFVKATISCTITNLNFNDTSWFTIFISK